jgi:copper homeostasis protein
MPDKPVAGNIPMTVPNGPSPLVLEVAVADVDDAVAAQSLGADRLELNSGMALGGLTPSLGLLRDVLSAVAIPVVVMIRPRPGGFCYSASQWTVAQRDAALALEAGAAGIVFGVLDHDGNVDVRRTADMVALAGPREVVFHRAFDLTRDWTQAVDALIELRVTRILTSGQQPTAVAGTACLQSLLRRAANRIQIVAGSGVRCSVIERLYDLGLRQFHGTFSRVVPDPGYDGQPFRFADNDQLRQLDAAELARTVDLMRRLPAN